MVAVHMIQTMMLSLLTDAAKEMLGDEKAIDLVDPVMGGEDFGRYLENVPGAFIRLGTCNQDKESCFAQHNSRFNVDDDALAVGMKVLCYTVIKAMDHER